MALGEREREVLQTLYYYACDRRVRVLARELRARTELPLFYFSSFPPGSRRRSVTGVTRSGIPPALVTIPGVPPALMTLAGIPPALVTFDPVTVLPTRGVAPSTPEGAGRAPVDLRCLFSLMPLAWHRNKASIREIL